MSEIPCLVCSSVEFIIAAGDNAQYTICEDCNAKLEGSFNELKVTARELNEIRRKAFEVE